MRARLAIFAAITVTVVGLATWKLIPSDQPPPLPALARTIASPSERFESGRPDPRPNSPVPPRAASIFISLAAQLRGGEHAEIEIDGEDGWRFHEAKVHYLDPQRVPAGVPLFVRLTYSGTTWGERAEARSFRCSSLLTFAVNRRYNLWCGERDDIVMTLLEEPR